MSLEIAKGVYRALGANGDDFVKFNSGNYVSKGDPHGAAGAAVEGRYLSDFLFGTRTLTEDEAQRLKHGSLPAEGGEPPHAEPL